MTGSWQALGRHVLGRLAPEMALKLGQHRKLLLFFGSLRLFDRFQFRGPFRNPLHLSLRIF